MFKPTPVGVSNHLRGAVLLLPLVLPSVLQVPQSNPKILRLLTKLLPKQTVDERLLKPEKKRRKCVTSFLSKTQRNFQNFKQTYLFLIVMLHWSLKDTGVTSIL